MDEKEKTLILKFLKKWKYVSIYIKKQENGREINTYNYFSEKNTILL